MAVLSSRSRMDFLWVLLALLGLYLLLWPSATTDESLKLDPLGIVYALIAGAFLGAVYFSRSTCPLNSSGSDNLLRLSHRFNHYFADWADAGR